MKKFNHKCLREQVKGALLLLLEAIERRCLSDISLFHLPDTKFNNIHGQDKIMQHWNTCNDSEGWLKVEVFKPRLN